MAMSRKPAAAPRPSRPPPGQATQDQQAQHAANVQFILNALAQQQQLPQDEQQ
jgi:hypothetical protein